MDAVTAEPAAHEVSAYRHIDKPEWGAAVVAWELDAKRGYQFEDGKMRVFKEGYFHLLTPVLLSGERGAVLLAQAGHCEIGVDIGRTPHASISTVTLDRQIDHLLANYPGGFVGEKWQLEHRDSGKQGLKRHRAPVIERAQRLLSRQQLDSWLAEPGCHQGWEALCGLLASTDLVSVADTKLLARVGGHAERAILERLRDLLWEVGPPADRFLRWVAALEQGLRATPSWPLATAPLALVQPGDQLCVRSSSIEAQASRLVPAIELRLGKHPNVGSYERALAMVKRIRERLTDRGVPPADLLDVGDFIWITLRPSARAQIEARTLNSWADQPEPLPI